MSRNNSRRQRVKNTREKQEQPTPPQPAMPQHAPSPFAASFVVPTEYVDLPTSGLFYPQESPLYNIESLEIKNMTAREEDILGNQDFISRGIVLDKLIESILIDKSVSVKDLADIDKVAILVTARKSGYGNSYDKKLTCPECGEESIYTHSLETLISNALNEEREEPEGLTYQDSSGAFTIDLPTCEYTATCKPLNNEDYQYIVDLEKQRIKHSLDFNYTIEFLRRMIISIHKTHSPTEITSDASIISQFLEFIPAKDSRTLKKVHSYLTPSFRMHEEVECPKCSATFEEEVPFSWAMFWGDDTVT